MIQKINENNYTVYTKQKTLNVPDTGEKFNLNYTQNGTSPETKDKEKVSDSKGPHAAEQSGVRLELSSEGRNADAHRQSPEEPAKAQSAPEQKLLFETIRTYIVSAIKAVQKFFHDIWYDQTPEPSEAMSQEPLLITGLEILPDDIADASAENFTDDMPDTPLEDSLEGMILQLLSEGKREQAVNLLTENGRRTVAKNTTLLTSYDKNGRVVEASASDRERTLHGDRNTWKL